MIFLDKLIKSGIAITKMGNWLYELVEDISKDYGIDSQIDQSKLYSI